MKTKNRTPPEGWLLMPEIVSLHDESQAIDILKECFNFRHELEKRYMAKKINLKRFNHVCCTLNKYERKIRIFFNLQ